MDLPDVQQAVRQIPGVAAASVRWPDPLGPASLRVEFEDGADQQAIGEAIIRTLVDVADVDLATMHLERANVVEHRSRPVFSSMTLERLDEQLVVQVCLSVDGRDINGRATGRLPEQSELHTAVEATLDAVHRTQAGPFTAQDVRQIDLGGDMGLVLVVIRPDDGHAPALTGTAVVVRDARESVVRATLDAVNRVLSVIAH